MYCMYRRGQNEEYLLSRSTHLTRYSVGKLHFKCNTIPTHYKILLPHHNTMNASRLCCEKSITETVTMASMINTQSSEREIHKHK